MSKRITVLISGSGSNLQALIDAQAQGLLGNGTICSVISSSKNAYGLTRASNANIPTKVHSLYKYTKGLSKDDKEGRRLARIQYEIDLAQIVKEDNPDIIVCAGWLLILGKDFLQRINDSTTINIPILNLHPALPGQFDGTTHAIEMAWKKCQELGKPFVAGCMVHYVIEEVDKGEPIVIKELEIVPGKETLEEYEARVHSTEHIAIVEATVKALQSV